MNENNKLLSADEIRNRIKEIRKVRFGDIKAHPRNPKIHGENQRKAFRGSVRELGFTSVPLVYESARNGGALTFADGHLRGSEVNDYTGDVAILDIDDAEADKLLLYADPIAAMAEYESQQLDSLLRDVNSGDEALTAMLAGIAAEAGLYPDKPTVKDVEPQIDKAEELRQKWGVQSGDLWQLGNHRLICGDCTDKATVERVMQGKRAKVCLTDPPYGLEVGKESGKNDYDRYQDTRENLIRLVADWLPIARGLSDVVVFSPGVTNAWIYPEADWVMCWFYGGGQLRSPWGFNCWQPFLCYGKDPSLTSGNGGRPDAVNMNTPANADDLDHPCPKPLELWKWFIGRLSFGDGDVFYEPFSGSGTTIIACEQLGRQCRAVEISPGYVAVALQRWADATNSQPVRVEA